LEQSLGKHDRQASIAMSKQGAEGRCASIVIEQAKSMNWLGNLAKPFALGLPNA
jgi:hypothetical protein